MVNVLYKYARNPSEESDVYNQNDQNIRGILWSKTKTAEILLSGNIFHHV